MKARTARARRLRAASTDAELRLWAALRGRALEGFKFRRQVAVDRYFADFACVEARLIVELDGSQHAQAAPYDEARTAALQAAGWHVLRIWNNEVMENIDGVAQAILAELEIARA